MKKSKIIFTLILFMITPVLELYAQYDFMYRGGSYAAVIDNIWRKEYRYTFLDRQRVERFIEHRNDPDYPYRNYLQSGTYTIDESTGVPFITFYWDEIDIKDWTSRLPSIIIEMNWHNREPDKYLMLVNQDMMVLYREENRSYFYGTYEISGNSKKIDNWRFLDIDNVTASNTLREEGVEYAATPDRLSFRAINRVWAVRGGINESLFIEKKINGFTYISIGYVSYADPALYRENSRPKRIRISEIGSSSNFYIHELKDTPNFQEINLEDFGSNIQIEILELYQGTKYNDTCINSLFYFPVPGQS